MKKRQSLFLAILVVIVGVSLVFSPQTNAFSSVLGARTIGGQEVSVDGHQVTDPKDPVVADSLKPTFSGYTTINAEVLLIVASDPVEVKTLSDANGYWTYTMKNSLEVGEHTLSLQITDSKGITSKKVLVATFVVPEVKGEEITAPAVTKTPRINYLSISLIVLGSLILLGATYAFLSRRTR